MNLDKRHTGLSQFSFYPGLPAGILFLALSFFLFWPLPTRSTPWALLVPANSFLGALGCFVISRRWLASFWASAIAGLVYGFGPFLLSFRMYHPLAGFGIAVIPWLFCPAALWHRYAKPSVSIFLGRLPMLLLPFLLIVLFYWLPAQPWVGPCSLMPSTQQLRFEDLCSLLEFPPKSNSQILIGLYANAVVLALMGLFVYSFLLRVLVLLPLLLAFILAFSQPILGVPPIVWMAIPMLFVSVLAGLGAQAMAVAGPADRKWILVCSLSAALFTAIGLVFIFSRPDGKAFRLPTLMYGITLLSTGILYLLCTRQIRLPLLRWLVIGTAFGANLFFSSRLILTSF
jgi:hypothetical protein